ncbi:Ig-like domain-containing protein [Yersinia enterocolitica]|nr:Ig-like domain-containing protein [Yersinia enterocolitica]
MANSAVGAIDIISRQNGALISEVAGNQSVVALNGLSIVRIHGTADSVASYERQGNDLILHMKDGTTVRYQHFFTADAEGNYSELVFDDGVNPPVHATFPTAVGAAAGVDAILVPQLTAIDSVAGLALGGSASSAGLLAGALGFLAIAGGIGIAASHNSNGNSGSGNIDPPPVTGGNPRPAPTLTVNPLTGDNRLNGSEVNSNQTLSGTTTGVAAGQLVNVTINGTTYTAKVQADGSWSVLLPAGVLQGLHDGSYPVVVTVANGSGQTAQQTVTLVVDTTAPTLTLSPVAGDGIINAAEAKATVVIGGTSSAIGATVTVVFNGKTYTGTVQSDGRWSVDVPASALVGLKDGSQSISATVSNSAGNSASASGSVMIDADPLNFPALFVNSFASDNHLNGAEQKVSQILSGATTHVEAGRLVLITLNNKTYSATVGADGKWSTQIPPADLAMLANGSATVHVEVTNAAGNPASKDSVFTVDNTQGGLGINPVSGDNLINANEAQTDLTVTGTSAGLAVNTAVKVTLNGVTYNGTVDANGNWSVLIPKGDLGKLTDGPITLTVEAAGLPDATLPLGIYINNLPAATFSTPFGDGNLNGTEAKIDQTLQGSTGVNGAGQTVTVSFNGVTYHPVVALDGSWSLVFPSAILQMLGQGNTPLLVTVSDIAGNSKSQLLTVNVDTQAPTLTVNPVAGDGTINAIEAAAPITLSGRSSEIGATVVITYEGKTYQAIVQTDGSWHVDIPAGALTGIADGSHPLTATVMDAAGNITNVTSNVTLDANPVNLPTLSINTFAGNNILDAAEQRVDQIVSGTTTQVESGRVVTILLNGKTYQATVGADGSWSVKVSAADLALLVNGNASITATVADASGNSTTETHNITVNDKLTGLGINPVTGDNLINAAEAAAGVTVSGTSFNVNAGQTITLTLNGKIYTAQVGADGRWSAQIPAADLAQLADGSAVLTASTTDAGGNPINSSANLGIYTHTLPTASLAPPFGDGTLNSTEAALGQTLTGSTGVTGNGQKVSVTLGGVTYAATVAADGSWSLQLPANALQGLGQGNQSLAITASDAAGNSNTLNTQFKVDTQAPTLTVAPIATDNIINGTEAAASITVRGTSSEIGAIVKVSIGGQLYSGAVQPDGSWSVTIPAGALSSLGDGRYVVSTQVQDAAGNSTTVTQDVMLDADPRNFPTLSINAFADNNILDGAEQKVSQTVSGSTTGIEAGRTITISLNGKTYSATVDSAGKWSTTIPAGDLALLTNGTTNITATVSDVNGNAANGSHTIIVNNTQSGIGISPLTGDNLINAQEAAAGITVNGTSSNLNANQTITVTLNGKTYTTTTGSNGNWSLALPAGDLALLADGKTTLTATATDSAGNTVSTSSELGVYIHSLPAVVTNLPFGDGTLNQTEAGISQSLNGTTGVTGAGQSVTVTVGGKTYQAAVGNDGQWSLTLPPSVLQGLAQGGQSIKVQVTDAAGNTNSATTAISVDTLPPELSVGKIAVDGVINATEAAANIPVFGTSNEVGALVNVVINGQTYSTKVSNSGSWSVDIPANTLNLLADGSYPITISIQDSAGNTTTVTENIKLVTQSVPNPTLTTPFADGYLNATEVTSSQTLSGSTGVSGAGQQVVVTVGGVVHTLVADSQGNWQLTLQPSELQNLPNGNLVISVTATDSAGNSNSYTGSATVDKIAPALVVNPISNDNIINAIEALSTVNITGNAPQSEAGRTVSVQLNGVTYSSLVQPDGTWSIPLSNSVLQGLADGNYPVRVTISDSAGNQTTVDRTLTIDASPVNLPTVTISSVSGDNFISRVESTKDVLINGVSSHVEAGRTVSVMLNGKTYSGTVQSDGNWQVTVPAADVSKLPEGALTAQATVTDVAGNPASDTHQVTVIASLADQPVLTVSTVTSDDIINYQESQSALTISGNSQRVQAGQTVTVSLHSKNYQGVVQADGSWSVSVPAGDVQALPQGNNVINATVNDVAQNPASSTHNVTVDTQAPLLTVDVQTNLDNVLNLADALLGLVVKGTCAGEAGLTVTVTLNGHNYKTQVQSDGSWSLTIPSADLLLLGDGPLAGGVKVSVTDAAGNESHDITNLNVAINALPTLTLAPLFGDNILSVGEISANATLTGSCSNLAVGTAVVVSIGGKNYSGSVTSNGVWSVNISAAALQSLNDGMTKVTVSATDADSGNKASASVDLDILIHNVPNITLPALPFGDGYLNKLEAAASQILTGNTGATGSGQTITLKIDGVTYPATVALDGTWICALPAGALNGLTDGSHTISITVTDRVGNSDTESVTFNSALNISPAPTFDAGPIIGGILNAAEAAAGGQLTGNTGIVGDKLQQVTVTINGTGYAATVTADGKWTLTLSPDVLQALPEGTWDVTVTAKDAAGNSGSLTSQVEVLTHNLPHPTLVLPFGDGVLNHAEALLGQTLSGSTGVTGVGQQVAISIDGKLVQTITANTDGSWSLPLLTGLLAGLANGPHTIGIKVTDRGGNEVTISPEITFTSQQLVPTPSIDTLSFGASINIAEAALATTISGKTGITGNNQNVQLKIDVGGISYSGVVDANTGNWTVTLPAGALNGLTNGQHQINVTVTDSTGNSSSQSANFDSFLTLPAPTISTPLFGATLNLAEAGTDQLLTGTTGLLNTAQTVKVTINGVVYNANVNIATGVWSVTVPTADLKQIPDGAQQPIRVDVTDGGGNSGSNSLNIGVVTHNLPTVTVDAPLFGAELDFAESKIPQLLSGSTTNIAQGSLVNISFGTLNLTAIVGADGKWSALVNSAQLGTLSGSAAISATVTDSAGNEGHTTNPINVNVNLSPPAVVLTINPIATDNIINATDDPLSITISGKVMGAGALGGTVLVSINGIPQIAPIVFGADGNWSVTLPKLSFPDGNYQITASVVGGTASEQVGLLVDRSPPTLTLSPFADNNILDALESKSPQLVSGVASTDDIGRTVTVTLNGKNYSALIGAQGQWSVSIPTADLQVLAQGSHTLKVTLTDLAGNPAEKTATIVVDTIPALITLDVAAPILNSNVLGSILSGTALGAEGKTLTLTLGSTILTTVVGNDGKWSITVLPGNLSGIVDGPLVAGLSVTDTAGNPSSSNVTVNVALNPALALTVDPLFNGGYLNAIGALVDQTLSGTVLNAGLGAKVKVTINGHEQIAEVGANGKWTLTLPAGDLSQLADGALTLNISVTDANNNVVQLLPAPVLNVLTHNLPTFGALDPLFGGDGILNGVESALTQTLGGVINNVAAGATVTVTIGTQVLTTQVQAGGVWHVDLLPSLLGGLQDGSLQVGISVKDVAGNIVNTQVGITVLTHDLPLVTLNPIFGDGILNAADLLLNQTISGTVNNMPAGAEVTIKLGTALLKAIIGADGSFTVPVDSLTLNGLLAGSLNVTASVTDSAGNTNTATRPLLVDVTLPVISLNPVFDDGKLSLADTAIAQIIGGTVSGVEAGTQVKVTLGGKTFFGTTTANGSFTIAVQPTDLTALLNGNLTVGVSVTDSAGNTGTTSGSVNVIINNVPKLILNPIFGDGLLSIDDSKATQIISGTVVNGTVGAQVLVQVGSNQLTAIVGTGGGWSVQVPSNILNGLLDGSQTISASLVDSAGNATSDNGLVNVLIHAQPTLSVNPIFGDGILSVADLLVAQTISGTTTNVALGTQINVVLNGKPYTATVGAGGNWSVLIQPVDLKTLVTDGPLTVNVSLQDAVGNQASTSGALSVIANALPTLSLDPVFGDGLLNAADALLTQTISGHSTSAAGANVTVKVGNLTLNTIVKADGSWSIAVPPSALAGLLDGSFTASANLTNAAGHSASATAPVTVGISLPTLTLNPFFASDSYLSGAESTTAQVISGTSTHAAGSQITVTVGGAVLTGIIGSDGHWSVPITPSALTGLLDGSAKIGVSVTDAVGNHVAVNTDFTVKTHALPLLGVDALGNVGNLLQLPTNGLIVSGSSLNVLANTKVKVTLLGQTLEGTVDSSGHWSVQFFGSFLKALNVVSILTTPVAVSVTDEAGNYKAISVGLLSGSGIQLLSADHDIQATSMMVTHDTDTSHLVEPLAQPIDSILTTTVTEGGYTIGGVTLNLADGVVMSGEALTGSSGADVFTVNSLNFNHIDGGLGMDTLLLGGVNQTLDLTHLGLKVEHIEIIDLGQSGSNSIRLDLQDALTLTDKPEDDLLIKGAQGGQVTLSNTPDGVWSSVGQRSIDGQAFDVYHNSSLDSSNTLGDVLIQHGLQVHLV